MNTTKDTIVVNDEDMDTGKIGASYDYLKTVNPTSYYYEKLKGQNNPMLLDNMFSEAALRGEENLLLSNLLNTTTTNPYFDEWQSWEGYNDYDGYMLAISIPNLDDTKKVNRTTVLDDGTEYSFGEYTDKEWAIKIFEDKVGRYEAVRLEEEKQNQSFWQKIGNFFGTIFLDLPARVVAGAADFMQDIYDVFEGAGNVLFNWSKEDNIGSRFLYAFSNNDNDAFEKVSKLLNSAAYMYEYNNISLFVNAVDAYDQGFRKPNDKNIFEAYLNLEGIGAGSTKWGQYWAGATQSIGYMLPSMFLPVPETRLGTAIDGLFSKSKVLTKLGISSTSLIKQGIFYAGIFSGNITSTIEAASQSGISYKDLNAGKVVANAALKAVGQWGVEVALAAILGASRLDQFLGLGTKAKKAVSVGTRAGAAVQWGTRLLKDAAKEGLEEFLQDTSDGLIDWFFSQGGKDRIYAQQSQQTLNISNLVDSFILGALTSIVMGGLADSKYIFKRAYGVDSDGKAYKLGAFQTMNFVDALKTMNEWNDIVQNENANNDLRMDAAFKLSVAYDSLSQLFTAMGSERIMKANQILLAQAADEKTKQQAILQMSDKDYASQLMKDFEQAQTKAQAKYVSQKILQDVEKQVNKKSKTLKEKLVTKIKNIFTKDSKVDPDADVDTKVQETIINALGELGVDAIVDSDGNIVNRSENILFVNHNDLIKGDISAILEKYSFDTVIEKVTEAMSEEQKNMIVKQYSDALGIDGTLNDAITALLFDKNFYCKVLLYSGESGVDTKTIELLATIDKVVRNKLIGDAVQGSLSEDAFVKLMEKVQQNMRSGLINFCMNYCLVDLDTISDNVLPPDLKQKIKDNANVQYTEFINKHKESDEKLTDFEKDKFVKAVDNCVAAAKLSAEERNEIVALGLSDNMKQKNEAFVILSVLSRYAHKADPHKLVYLPANTRGILVTEAIQSIEAFTGFSWQDIIDGNIDFTKMTDEFKDYLGVMQGIDWNNKEDRLMLLDTLLFQKSNKKLTIDNNGNLLRIIDKQDFCKVRYSGEDGKRNLVNDIKEGKVKTIGDIAKIKLAKEVTSIDINYDVNENTRSGWVLDGHNTVYLGTPCTVDTVLHELTHIIQNQNKSKQFNKQGDKNLNYVAGGSPQLFTALPNDVLKDINDWIKENYPTYYKITMKLNSQFIPQVIYLMLEGEIRARATVDTLVQNVGFKYADNENTLVSPDGKKRWKLPSEVDLIKQSIQNKISRATQQAQMLRDNITRLNDIIDGHISSIETETDNETIDALNKQLKGFIGVRDKLKSELNQLIQDGLVKPETTQEKYDALRRSAGLKPKEIDAETQKQLTQEKYEALRRSAGLTPRPTETKTDTKKVSEDITPDDNRFKIGEKLKEDIKAIDKQIKDLENQIEDESNTTKALQLQLQLKTLKSRKSSLIMELGSNMTKNKTTETKASETKPKKPLKNVEVKRTKNIQKSERVYISNERAQKSNLRNWIRKGIPIQISEGIANFVEKTTNDFDKISDNSPLKKAIKSNQPFNMWDVINYVATATNISDYEFQAIAKYIFKNEAVAKLTYKDMLKVFDNIQNLFILSSFEEFANQNLTIDQMIELSKKAMDKIQKDPNSKFASQFTKQQNKQYNVTVFDRQKGQFYTTEVQGIDTKQLNSVFFRHYDGTLQSIRDIFNMAKFMSAMQDSSGYREGKRKKGSKTWNWTDNTRRAEINYEGNKEVSTALDNVSREEKIKTVREAIINNFAQSVENMSEADRNAIKSNYQAYIDKVNEALSVLKNISEQDLNERYLSAINAEASQNKQDNDIQNLIRKPRPTKLNRGEITNKKNTIRNVGRRITQRIAGLKTRYNLLSPEVKEFIDSKTYNLNDKYKNLTLEELTNLAKAMQQDASKLSTRLRQEQITKENKIKEQQRLEKETKEKAEREAKEKAQQQTKTEQETKKKTMKEKVQHVYKTEVHEQQFSFKSNRESNNVVKNILGTNFSKRGMSNVKGVDSNIEQQTANMEEFYKANASTFIGATISEIEEAALWFAESDISNATGEEAKKYQAVKIMFLGYVLQETRKGGAYENLNNNVKQKIDNILRSELTNAGTTMSIWSKIQARVDPYKAFMSADIELDGVKLDESQKTKLFDAIQSGNVDKIRQAQLEIYKNVSEKSGKNKSILRKITALRSMSMLSSPITWLRNKVSNIALKRIYKMSDAIGSRLFKGKHVEGQLKLDKQVTVEIQNFINEHFIDNKLFDTFVGQLSRYNPSDISNKSTETKATKEQIMAKLVIKTMYSQYYNNEMFKSPFMKQLHEKLMKMLSDNNYVRESAVRTFGKIIAERGYDLSNNEVTDAIMNDFSIAIGMAMSEYMHSDNMFNQIEKWIADRSELGLFTYKLLFPYMSSSWNWFKAMVRLSPIGLVRSVVKMTRLEQNIAKQQELFNQGKTQISGELAEYMIRRDLGQGVIGTIAWGVGMLLAGLGFVKLDDDDYGTPKLKVGNIELDVSSIFGSSSVLAGAALITQIQKNGMNLDGFVKGLNSMSDVWLDQLPIMDIVQMDMYSDGGFSMGMDQLESIAISFIPNILGWLAGATYTGQLKKSTFLHRAMAKIPFVANLVPKKVDPYTGETGSWIDIINRVVPYISIVRASENKIRSTELGLNKQQLDGTYYINGEKFSVSGKDLMNINQAYGKWNAEDLTKFYDNQMSVKVKVGNTYKTLYYNQMDDTQRKSAVQTIMQNNAELAKIIAWLNAGNKYYASATIYNKLRKAGYTQNLYRGTKGFVKS